MNTNTLIDLYRHMEWADATVWAAVLESANARADDRLRGTLYHLHMVQRAFVRVWRGEPRDAPYPTFDDTESMMAWAMTYYAEAVTLLDSLTDEQISEPIAVPWASMVERRIGRAPGPTSMSETALQVALHSQYHRGQVNARIREVGGTPPLVDFIAWVWLGRPAATWPDIGSQP